MYTYAFLLTPDQPFDLPQGMTGAVEMVQLGKLSAVVEPELDLTDVDKNDTRLMQSVLWHDQVIQELFRQTTVLPLRFGTQFRSRETLLEHLRQGHEEYVSRLHQLTGQAEFLLKASPIERIEPAIAPEIKGKDYFRAKKERFQQQADYIDQQRTEFEQLKQAIASHYPNSRLGEAVEGIERIYLLHDRSAEPHLRDQLTHWQTACSTWSLYLSEALPPYHFV
jgi:Gas vesicle synthesis protein GvpL/GvpF